MAKKRKRVHEMKHHYTYRITNIIEKKYYYGVHSCDCLPKEDIGVKYFSSSKNKEFIKDQKENPQNYKYKVVKIFSTRVEALEHEIFLHAKFNVGISTSFYNGAKHTSVGFDVSGKCSVKDMNGNTFSINIDDTRYLSGELQHINKNMVQIKDVGKIRTVTVEEFKENNYDMVFKNTVSIIDKNGNKYRVSKEEFDNNPDLYGQTKNKFVAIDKNGIKHHIYNTDERYLSGELQAESKGRKWSDKAKMNIKDRKCRRWIFNPTSTECKFINSSETLDYIENGWQYGRSYK